MSAFPTDFIRVHVSHMEYSGVSLNQTDPHHLNCDKAVAVADPGVTPKVHVQRAPAFGVRGDAPVFYKITCGQKLLI